MPTSRSRPSGTAAPAARRCCWSARPGAARPRRHRSPTPRRPRQRAPGRRAAADAARDVAREVRAALERRAAAVRRDDARGLRAGLAAPAGVRARSSGPTSRNLAQLPLARFGYALDPGTPGPRRRATTGWWSTCACSSTGTTTRPVTTPDRFRFAPARRRPGRFLLASTTDRGLGAAPPRAARSPGTPGRSRSATGAGVLGIFDARQRRLDAPASRLGRVRDRRRRRGRALRLAALGRRLRAVRPGFLTALRRPARATTRPAWTRWRSRCVGAGGPVAATRFVLNPRDARPAGAPERDRLVRHELTHVAVGEHDDRAPVWLSEGIAE